MKLKQSAYYAFLCMIFSFIPLYHALKEQHTTPNAAFTCSLQTENLGFNSVTATKSAYDLFFIPYNYIK